MNSVSIVVVDETSTSLFVLYRDSLGQSNTLIAVQLNPLTGEVKESAFVVNFGIIEPDTFSLVSPMPHKVAVIGDTQGCGSTVHIYTSDGDLEQVIQSQIGRVLYKPSMYCALELRELIIISTITWLTLVSLHLCFAQLS